eukprot:1185230-Prorocentrum_minimum.AAC.1
MCVPSAVVCSTHYLSSGVLDSRKGIAKSAEFGWPENHMRTSVAAVFVTPEQEFRAGSIIRAFQEVFYTVLVNEGRYKTLAKLVPLKFVCRQEFVFGLRRQWRRPPKFEGLEGRHEGRGSLTLERACRMSTGPLQDLTSTCPWKGSGGPTLRMPSACGFQLSFHVFFNCTLAETIPPSKLRITRNQQPPVGMGSRLARSVCPWMWRFKK